MTQLERLLEAGWRITAYKTEGMYYVRVERDPDDDCYEAYRSCIQAALDDVATSVFGYTDEPD
jgi:hypothetical protein